LNVEPAQHFINWQQDPQGNYQARLVFPEKTDAFKVTVDLVAEMAVYNPFDFFLAPHADLCPFKYEESDVQQLAPFLVRGALTPRFGAYLAQHQATKEKTIDYLVGLNQQLWKDISYTIRMEPGVHVLFQAT